MSHDRGVLDPNDRVQVTSVCVEGNRRTQASLFVRFLQETALPVRLPESEHTHAHTVAEGEKSAQKKALITPRTCLSCVPLPAHHTDAPHSTHTAHTPSHIAHNIHTPPHTVEKLSTVHGALVHVTSRLLQLNLFDAVDANLVLDEFDREKKIYKGKVVLTVQEKGIPFLNLSSSLTPSLSPSLSLTGTHSNVSSAVGLSLQAALRSPLGHGETLSLGMGASPTGAQREFNASLSVPAVGLLSMPAWVKDRECETASEDLEKSFKAIAPTASLSHTRTDCHSGKRLLAHSLTGGALSLSLRHAEDRSLAHISSLTQSVHTLALQYSTPSGRHQVHCEAALRDEIPLTQTRSPSLSDRINGAVSETNEPTKVSPSPAVLASALSGLKHSLKHIYTAVDTRPVAHKERESEGALLQFVNEIVCHSHSLSATAALLNPLLYVKNEVLAQRHIPLFDEKKKQDGLTFSLAGVVGVLSPLNAALHTPEGVHKGWCPLPDRYHLGGPLSLRGFDVAGVGARANVSSALTHADRLGGTAKASFLALLSSPAVYGSRAFLFLNGGSLGQGALSLAEIDKAKKPDALPFFGYPRVSVGAGLSLSFQNTIRLEMTYSLPLVRAERDLVKPFQIGLGLSIN